MPFLFLTLRDLRIQSVRAGGTRSRMYEFSARLEGGIFEFETAFCRGRLGETTLPALAKTCEFMRFSREANRRIRITSCTACGLLKTPCPLRTITSDWAPSR